MTYVVSRKIKQYKFTKREVKYVYQELLALAKRNGMTWVGLYKYMGISKSLASTITSRGTLTTRTAYLIIIGLETPLLDHPDLLRFLLIKVQLVFPLAAKECTTLSEKTIRINNFKVYLHDALCREDINMTTLETALECSVGKIHTQVFTSGSLTSLVLQTVISVSGNAELRSRCLQMQKYLNKHTDSP